MNWRARTGQMTSDNAFVRAERLYLSGVESRESLRILRNDFRDCALAVTLGMLLLALAFVPLAFAIWATSWSLESANRTGSATYLVAGPGMFVVGAGLIFGATKSFPWKLFPFLITFLPVLVGAKVGLVQVGVRTAAERNQRGAPAEAADGLHDAPIDQSGRRQTMAGEGWVAFESDESPIQTVVASNESPFQNE